MNRSLLLIATLLAGALATTAVSAAPGRGFPNGAHDRLERLMRHGIASGELVPIEVRRLRERRHRLAHLERRFRADGHLGRGERRILRRRTHRLADEIRDLSRNGWRRPPRHVRHRAHDRFGHRRDAPRRHERLDRHGRSDRHGGWSDRDGGWSGRFGFGFRFGDRF